MLLASTFLIRSVCAKPLSQSPLVASPFLDQLQQAANSAGTDKVSTHQYDQVYGRFLEPFQKTEQFAMVEVGYGGGAGISLWTSVFPQTFLYCLDCDVVDQWHDRTCLLKVDQASIEDLERAITAIRHPISLIIDDGSHHPSHQLLSFSIFFEQLLCHGGIYIIEDIETSYWRRGSLYDNTYSHGLGDRRSAVEAFKLLADFVNRRFLDPADENFLAASLLDVGISLAAASAVETVCFGRNAIVLTKRAQAGDEPPPKPYFHSWKTSRHDPRGS